MTDHKSRVGKRTTFGPFDRGATFAEQLDDGGMPIEVEMSLTQEQVDRLRANGIEVRRIEP